MKEVTMTSNHSGWRVGCDSRRKGKDRTFFIEYLEGSDLTRIALPWTDLNLFVAVLEDLKGW